MKRLAIEPKRCPKLQNVLAENASLANVSVKIERGVLRASCAKPEPPAAVSIGAPASTSL
jgi:hypothetical protein